MDANALIDQFQLKLETLVEGSGWALIRWQNGHSDRGFELANHPRSPVRFTVKMSQSSPGFWGLGIQKAASMIQPPGEYLILLGGNDQGYFINPIRLAALIPKFGKDAQLHDYKINESKVRREQRFRSLDELWELLRSRLGD